MKRPTEALDAWLEAWVREPGSWDYDEEDIEGAKSILAYIADLEAERDRLREALATWKALLQLETWDDGTWLVSVVDQRIARELVEGAALSEEQP